MSAVEGVEAERSGRAATAEWLVIAAAVVYPLQFVLNEITGTNLHLSALPFGLLLAAVVIGPRSRPLSFPAALDVLVLGFCAIAVLGFLFLAPITEKSRMGLFIEARFAIVYFAVRWLRPTARVCTWLLAALLALAVVNAAIGLVEYHLSWGAIRDLLGRTPWRTVYWKDFAPRLYGPLFEPVPTGYFSALALVAAAYFTDRQRWQPGIAASVFVLWAALPLTLTRAPIALALAVCGAFPLMNPRRGLPFVAWTLGGLAFTWTVGTLRASDNWVAGVAEVSQLRDGSATLHWEAVREGLVLLLAHPLGMGLGESGSLANELGGAHPYRETQYITTGVQLGVVGLVCWLAIVAVAGLVWLGEALHADRRRRALGCAGLAMWWILAAGGLFHATWSGVVAQTYFWAMTAVSMAGAGAASPSIPALAASVARLDPALVRRLSIGTASAALAGALAVSGGVSGWRSLLQAELGERALRRAEAAPQNRRALKKAIGHLARAVADDPLLPSRRRALEATVARAAAEGSLVELAPRNASSRAAFMAAAAEVGSFAAVEPLGASLPKLSPAEVRELPPASVRSFAFFLAKANRCRQAIPLFEAALAAGAMQPDLYYARCHSEAGDPRKAIEIARPLHERWPHAQWPALIVGTSHLKLGELADADRVARHLTKERPEYYWGWDLRARVAIALGLPREAAEAWRHALALVPEANASLRARTEALRSEAERLAASAG